VTSNSEPRCIAHCDADRFYFAVEALERPELAELGRPVVVSSDPRVAPRAVVTTANDPARALGISSGMSSAYALRLAPDALFVPPRHSVYREYSSRVMDVLREASPVIQPLSLDEAWLEWGHRGFDPGAAMALREEVLGRTGLSISISVATSKLVSKMATETAKPGGVRVVQPGEEEAFLAPQPIRALFGVGPRTAERLAEVEIVTIGDLAARSREELVELLGQSHGTHLWESARGIDRSEVQSHRDPKSYSAERTFQQDTRDRRALWSELRAQAEEVGERLRSDGLLAGEVAIKLRYANFETLTRQRRLTSPTNRPEALAEAAALLMRLHWDRSRPIRLIGLRTARFTLVGGWIQLGLPLSAASLPTPGPASLPEMPAPPAE
jgi:DNA polymerase-4